VAAASCSRSCSAASSRGTPSTGSPGDVSDCDYCCALWHICSSVVTGRECLMLCCYFLLHAMQAMSRSRTMSDIKSHVQIESATITPCWCSCVLLRLLISCATVWRLWEFNMIIVCMFMCESTTLMVWLGYFLSLYVH
jgi:hypothetical protein